MRILITGGAGFIGSNLALRLLEKKYEITVLDSLSQQIHGDKPKKSELYLSIKDKVRFILGTVTSREDWKKALQEVDVIVHFAAETGTGQSMYEIEKYVNTNINGTAIMWDILANEKHKVKKVVVAASRAIYGEGKYYCKEHKEVYPIERGIKNLENKDFEVKCPICNRNVDLLGTTEDSKIHPTSVYGLTKSVQEEISLLIGQSLNIPVVTYRYQNVYGPGQSLKNPYTGILSIFSTRIKNNNEINIFEDGKESRDFVYISDVVEATILGIEKEEANYQSFNVGTGVNTSVLAVAETLKKLYKSEVKIKISGNFRIGDIRHNFADISKIEKLLGYEPKYSFEKGMEEFVKWVNKQPIEKDDYENSILEMKEKGLYK
ncbi:NAD-dependent epimerase/dehydratase family protein [Fusobacterium varium]|uniref:NAD-dependent epimerase/dehydratase family protein n=1 Tax=Fusobacterium varium TaxID=856 RepID=UPI001F225529|nr:NAD-dependent epimerase/dehydratase family protein [Fusobacterium varium]MCF2674472.1 SDR family NAD(P)-dependent oxidoreductase [Fusobacterium varium]